MDDILLNKPRGLGVFSRGEDALRWLSSHKPVVAILDVQLADSTSAGLLSKLEEQNVPVLIYSGMPDNAALVDSEFASLPSLKKPASINEMTTAIRQVLAVHVAG